MSDGLTDNVSQGRNPLAGLTLPSPPRPALLVHMKYLLLQIVLAFSLASAARAADPPMYERDIRPIFKAACFHCHGEEAELQGALDLRLKRFILKGGDSGAAIVPGDPVASLLMERITSGEMPPGDVTLTEDEIDRIRDWIIAGAPTARPEPEDISPDDFTHEERNFWSLQPIVEPAVPQPKDGSRVRTPVDAFVLARLEQDGLAFSRDADRTTLIRRLSFDLVGLPPTPEEVASFVADTSPDAYENLVDRLLASPHYGERWGRHWLDVAGYADSEGMTEEDRPRPSAFRYRDYVIQSFNHDRPFDQFIVEQLAGDELVTGPYNNMSPETIEKLTATGFLRMAPDGTASGGIDQDVARNQVISETVKIVSTALMGLTVGCAECHDHRYDPILQKDYYALRAIFEPALNWKQWRTPPAREISLYTDVDRAVAAEIEARAKEADAKRLEVANEFVAQTLESQLQKLDVEVSVRDALRSAYQTAAKERTSEQAELLDKYPKIKQISIGSLYLYDREIRTDAAKLESERKEKEAEYVARAAEKAVASVPEETQPAVKAAAAVAAGKRTDEQKSLLQQNPGVLVTAATLEQFDPEGAAELAQLKQVVADLLASQKANRLDEMQKKVDAIRAEKPLEGFMRALTEVPGQVPDTFLFFRGELSQPKDKVPAAGLSVLADRDLIPIPQNDPSLPTTGRRLAFARRLTDGRHPLTARGLVNRFWLHYFGQGSVATP